MNDELLTIQQAAAFLGVSTKTLRRWEAKGHLNPQRTIGNQRRFSKAELTTLFQNANGKAKIQNIPMPEQVSTESHAEAVPVDSSNEESSVEESPIVVIQNIVEKPTRSFKGILFAGAVFAIALCIGIMSMLIDNQQGLQKGLGFFSGKTSSEVANQHVLGANEAVSAFQLNVEVPSMFGKEVTFLDKATIEKGLTVKGLSQLNGGIKTNNEDINAGSGKLTASNVLYSIVAGSNITISGNKQNPVISAGTTGVSSLEGVSGAVTLANGSGISLNGLTINNTGVLSVQGTTGAVTFNAGNGVSISGTTITNSDTGSGQNIFKTFSISGTDISASSNNDTINFAAGSGISLVGDPGSKTITITGSGGGLSGLTTNGVLYATSTSTASSVVGTNGTVLHGVTGGAPSFSSVDLTSDVANILPLANGGTGVGTAPTNGELLIGNGSGYQLATITQGAGLGVANGAGTITLSNTGVTSAVAGSGISLSGGTGAITITNNGVLSLTGTANEVNVSGSTGAIVLSLPQDIATSSSPSFTSLNVTASSDQLVLGSGNTATITTGTLTSGRTYTLPDGSGTFCLVELNNCSGGGGGGVGGSGSQFYIPVFSGATSLTDSDIYDSSGSIGIGTTSPQGLFSVSGTSPGFALTELNQTGTGDILTGSASGVTRFVFDSNGDLNIIGGGYEIGGASVLSSTQLGTSVVSSSLTSVGALSSGSLASGFGTIAIGSSSISGGDITSSGTTGFSASGNGAGVTFSGTGNHIISASSGTFELGASTLIGDITANNKNITGVNNLSAAGAITFSSFSTNNGLLYTSGTGQLAQSNAGASGQVLLSNSGTPTFTSLSGDVASVTGAGSVTLKNVGTSGTYGSASQVPVFTTDAQGRVTGVTNTSIAIDASQIISGQLSVANGGTNTNSIGSNGEVAYSSGSSYAFTTVGSLGQVLESNGGGAPTWASAASLGTNYFQLLSGALSPVIESNDLLLGSTATTSAKFAFENVGSGVPTASISAGTGNNGTYLSGNGTLGTTNGQSLTLGSASTGNIGIYGIGTGVVQANSGLLSTGLVQNNELQNNSLTVTAGSGLSGGGTVALGNSITLTNAGVTSAVAGTGISVSGATGAVTITNSGVTSLSGTTDQVNVSGSTGGITLSLPQNIDTTASPTFTSLTLSSFTSAGGPLYTNGSGALAQATAGTAHQVLHGGATPSFGAVDLTADVTGILPVADGGTNTNSIGSNGEVAYSSGSSYAFTTVGNLGQVLESNGGGAPTWASAASLGTNYFQLLSGALSPVIESNDLLLGSTATTSAKFAFENVGSGVPTASISAGTGNNGTYLSGNGTLGTTNGQSLTLGSASTGNIGIYGIGTGVVQANSGLLSTGLVQNNELQNNSLTVTAGSGLSGGGTVALGNSITLTNAGVTSAVAGTGISVSGTTGAVTITNSGVTSLTGGSGGSSTLTGALTITNSVSSGTTVTLDKATTTTLGIASFSSSNFSVSGGGAVTIAAGGVGPTELATTAVTSGTYGGAGNGVGEFTVDSDGRLTFAGNRAINLSTADVTGTLGVGNGGTGTATSFTQGSLVFAGASGIYSQDNNNLFYNATSGLLGVGTSSPTSRLSVNGLVAGKALSIFNYTGTDQNIIVASTSGTEEFAVNNNGNVQFNGGSGFLNTLSTTGTFSSGQTYSLPNSGGTICILQAGNCAGSGSGVTHTGGGVNQLTYFDGSNDITSSSNLLWNNDLEVTGANGSKAAEILNQLNSGNILTASASGTTEFNINNNGNLQFAGGSSFLNTITTVPSTAARTYTFPDVTGTVCLVEAGNCAGSGSGVTHTGGGVNQLTYFDGSNDISSSSNLVWNNDLEVTGSNGGKAALIVNQTNSGNIFTASASGTTKFTIGNDGTVTAAKYTTNNGLLYTNGLGVITQAAAGTDAQVLVSNSGTPTFATISGDATISNTGVFTLKNVGTSGTYGSASQVPVFTTDAQGRVTGVTNTSIAIVASQITSGQLSAAQGGTGADLSAANQYSIPYFGTTGVMTYLTPGTSGYVLTTNNTSGAPTWTNAASLGTNYWSQVAGVLSPLTTNDVLAATSSATTVATFTTTNPTGTLANNTLIQQTGAGTVTNLLNLTQSAGTVTNAISTTGTFGDILTVGSTPILNGSGVLLSVGLSGTYSNALTLSNVSNSITAGTLTATGGTLDNVAIGNTTQSTAKVTTLGASGTVTFSNATYTAGGLLKATSGTGVLTIATAGTDYQVPLAFNNGLTNTSNTVQLGGSLTQATSISFGAANNILTLGDNTGTGDLVVSPNAGGKAALIVNDQGSGSLFTASVSGSTKFVITNGGSLNLVGGQSSDIDTLTAASLTIGGSTQNGLTLGRAGAATTINGSSLTISPTSWTATPTISGLITAAAGLTVNTGQSLTLAGLITNDNSILYTNGSGVVGAVTTSTGGECLVSQTGPAAPIWGSCATGTTNYWQTNNGTLEPVNTGNDLLLGGTATTSAKFAFINNAAGTPTASISANLGNNATYLSGLGVLGTTNGQTLQLGAAGTGNVVLSPGGANALTALANGNVGIGTSAPTSLFSVGGTSQFQVNSTGAIAAATGITSSGTIDFSGLGTGLVKSTSGTLSLAAAGTDYQVPLAFNNGLTNTSNTVQLGGSLTQATSISFGAANNILTLGDNTGTGDLVVSPNAGGKAALIVNDQGSGSLFTASVSGSTKFVITNGGSLNLVGGQSSDIDTLTAASLTIGGSTQNGLTLGRAGAATTINGSSLTISPTSWTATPTISGLITAAAGLTVNTGQSLTLAGLITNDNSILYTNGSGVVGAVTTSTGGECLVSQTGPAAPIWGSCATGTTNYWQTNNGTLEPVNTGNDLLLGGTATTSAKFAFINNAAGTPTASISANLGNNATYLSGLGVLGTTNGQTLQLGAAGTGNILIDSPTALSLNTTNNKAITTGTGLTTLGGNLTINGTTGISLGGTNAGITFTSGTNVISSSGTALQIDAFQLGGTENANSDSITGINIASFGSTNLSISGTTIQTTSGTNNITITPNSTGNIVLTSTYQSGVLIGSSSNTPAPLSISGGIGNNGALIVNQINSGDILDASQSGNLRFQITNGGSLNVAGGQTIDTITAGSLGIGTTTQNGLTLGRNGAATTINGSSLTLGGTGFNIQGGLLYMSNGTGAVSEFSDGTLNNCLLSGGASAAPTWGSCGTGLSQNFWQMPNSGAIAPFSTTADLLLGGTATTSADFAFEGVDSTNPTASISAFTNSGNKNGISLSSSASTIQSLNNNTLTIGGNTTGNVVLSPGGTTALTALNNGNLVANGTLTGLAGITSSGTVTLTGLGASAFVVTDGSKNLTTSVGSATSAELASILSDETGTGVAVFGTAPQFTTSIDSLSSTFGLFATPTTINFGTAATALNVGASGGTITVGNGGASTLTTSSNGSLTLAAAGTGNLTLSSDFNSSVFVGNATTPAPLSISGGIGNNGLLIVNNNNSGDLIDASASGVTKFQVSNAGNVTAGTYNGNTITTGTGTLTLAAGKTLTLNDNTTFNTNSIQLAGETLTLTNGQNVTFSNGMTLAGTNGNTYIFPSVNSGTVLTTNQTSQTINSGQTSGTILAINAGTPALSGGLTGQSITLNGTNAQSQTGISFAVTGTGALKDINGTGGNWSVTSAGLGTFSNLLDNGLGASSAVYTDVSKNLTTTAPTSGTIGYFQRNLGALSPANITDDLLLGGTATTSAEFAFTGIASNTPIASIAATPTSGTSNGLSLNGATNTIQSLNRKTLTIGGNTTGDIAFQAGGTNPDLYLASNGNVGIGTSIPAYPLDLESNAATIGNGAIFNIQGSLTSSGLAQTAINSEPTVSPNNTSAQTYYGGLFQPYSTSANLVNDSIYGLMAQPIYNGSASNVLNLMRGINIQNKLEGGGILAGSEGMFIDNPNVSAGTLQNNAGLIINQQTAGGNENQNLVLGINFIPSNNWSIYNASSYNNFFGGNLEIAGAASANPLGALDVRSLSATQPTASVSGATTFAEEVIDQSGSGDLFTASKSGATKFVITNSGNVGIGGVTQPYASLEVGVSNSTNVGAADPEYMAVTDYSNNAANVTGWASYVGNWDSNNLWGLGAATSTNGDNSVRLGTVIGNTNSFNTQQMTRLEINGAVGHSGLAALDVGVANATLPVASFSGSTNFAGLVVDNSGSGDLFTASSSGLTRFTIQQNGNILLGQNGAATASNVTISGAQTAGSNEVGGNLTLAASNGTGTGGSGSLNFQVAGPSTAAPQFDTEATANTSAGSSLSWKHTVGAGSNRILVVGVTLNSSKTVSSVTYGGQALTKVTSGSVTFSTYDNEMWYLLNPPQETATVTVTASSGTPQISAGSEDFYNVNQTTPFNTVHTSSGTSANPSNSSISSGTNQLVIDHLGINDFGTVININASGQTATWITNALVNTADSASYKPSSGSTTTMSWTLNNSNNYGDVAAALEPVTATNNDGYENALTITSNGNVGIGTSTPGANLSVAGSISNLTSGVDNPTLVASTSAGLSTKPTTVAVQGKYAYVTDVNSNKLITYDITNPSSPQEIGTLSGVSGYITVQGRYAYIVPDSGSTFSIIDISNPASPTIAGSSSSGLSGTLSQVVVQGKYAYVADYNNADVEIFDVSNPANPIEVGITGTLSSSATGVVVQGRYAYIVTWGGEVYVYDISNPSAPVQKGTVDNGTESADMAVSGNYAYVTDFQQGLIIYDISNPASPTFESKTFSGLYNPYYVTVSGRYAYVTDSSLNTLNVYDVSSPTSPSLVGDSTIGSSLSLPGQPVISGQDVYLPTYGTGSANGALLVYNIGGIETTAIMAHSAEVGSLTVDANANIANELSIGGGLNVGAGGIYSAGAIAGANLNINGNIGTSPNASISGATSFAGLLVDNSGSGDLFTASKSGATKFTITNAGNIIAPNYNGNNAVLYGASGTGAITAVATTSTGGQCLLSGASSAAPTWGSCNIGNTSWVQANGSMYEGNTTEDLLLGGTATTSAKFAFINNIGAGTPTASISANSGANATYLTGTGTLGTTNRQTLTLGSTSTGDIAFNPGNVGVGNSLYLASNGNVGIGTSTPNSLLQVENGISDLQFSSGTGGVTPTISLIDTSGKAAALAAGTTGSVFVFDNSGVFGIAGNTNSKITSNNAADGTETFYEYITSGGNVGFGTTTPGNAELVVNQPNAAGDIFDASQSGNTKFVITNAGNVGIGTTSPLATLDARGNSATTPVASISGNTNEAALVVDNSGSGDLFTASSAGLTKFTVQNNGNILLGENGLASANNVTISGAQTAGSNEIGGNLTLAASNGTGTGGSGGFNFQVSSGVTGAPVFDSEATASQNNDTAHTLSWNHTVGANGNRILIVGVALDNGGSGASKTVSSITYGGQSLTQESSTTYDSGHSDNELWYLLNPPQGKAQVTVTISGTADIEAGSADYYNVNQTSPFGTVATPTTGNSTSPSITVSSGTNQLVIDHVTEDNCCSYIGAAGTLNGSQIEIWNDSTIEPPEDAASYRPSAGSTTTMKWSLPATIQWSQLGVALQPVTASNNDGLRNALTIASNGNIGIGTATPSANLSVVGSISDLANNSINPSQIASTSAGLSTQPDVVVVQGKYAYVGDGSGRLVIYDISNPASPTEIGSLTSGIAPGEITVQGRYVYAADGNGALEIIDVSNPANPVLAGKTTSGLSFPTAIVVSGRYAYITDWTNQALYIYDVSNPANPVRVGSYTGFTHTPTSVYVQGRYAYVVQWGGVINVIDVSNPANPTSVGNATTGLVDSNQIVVSGRYAYIADQGKGLVIYDISNPASPSFVTSTTSGLASPENLAVSGRYAYVTDDYYDTLNVYDVSTPSSPAWVGSSPIGTGLSNPTMPAVSGLDVYVPTYGTGAGPSPGSLLVYSLGSGIETQALLAHSAEVGTLNVDQNADIANQLSIGGGLDVGSGGIYSSGAIAGANLNINGNIGTSPNASVSGATSFAGLVVDNSGSGDILTASSSGLTRFTVQQNGNILLGQNGLTTPNNISISGAQAGGSNTTGGNLMINAQNGTGTGGSGNITFQTGSQSTSPVTLDLTSSVQVASTTATISWLHTVNNNSNRILIVQTGTGGIYSSHSVNSVRYGNNALTKVTNVNSSGSKNSDSELWYLLNPPNGTAAVYVNFKSTQDDQAGAASDYYNVNQTTPLGTAATNSGNCTGIPCASGTTASNSVSSILNQMVVDAVLVEDDCTGGTGCWSVAVSTPGSGQTQIINSTSADNLFAVAQSNKSSTTPTTGVSWKGSSCTGCTAPGLEWTEIDVPLNPALSGSATASDTLTNSLTIQNSGVVTIGNNTNGIQFDPTFSSDCSGQLFAAVYCGSARPTRQIVLSAEYPGAVLTASNSASTNGFMTANASQSATPSSFNYENYYQWTSNQSSLNDYTVAVTVTLPKDFSGWPSSGNAMTIDYNTALTTSADNALDVYIYNKGDTTNIPVYFKTNNTSASQKTWTTVNITGAQLTGSSSLNAAGQQAVVYLRMHAMNTVNYVQVGDIKLNYLSAF